MLTTADVQVIVWGLVIARSHSNVKRGVRGTGVEAVSWTIEGSYIGEKTSVRDLKEPWGVLSAMSLSKHTGPWNQQSVVVAWKRRKEGEGGSQALFREWEFWGKNEQAWGRVA
jgi:hypothetical protein